MRKLLFTMCVNSACAYTRLNPCGELWRAVAPRPRVIAPTPPDGVDRVMNVAFDTCEFQGLRR